jgi:hypothetical protein
MLYKLLDFAKQFGFRKGGKNACSRVAATNIWQRPSCFLAKLQQHLEVCYKEIQTKDIIQTKRKGQYNQESIT